VRELRSRSPVVVDRGVLGEMGGVEEGVLDELADVAVGEPVVHEVALTTSLHDPSETEFAEVLGNGGGGFADALGELVDAELLEAQIPDDAESSGICEQRERLHGHLLMGGGQPLK
jgi:hypothetical protein